VAALTALRKRQFADSAAAGAAYQAALADVDWYQGGEYVITNDQSGNPAKTPGNMLYSPHESNAGDHRSSDPHRRR